jgi:hypothetical protein
MSTQPLPHRTQVNRQTQELRWLALFSVVCCLLSLSADAVFFPAVFAALAVFPRRHPAGDPEQRAFAGESTGLLRTSGWSCSVEESVPGMLNGYRTASGKRSSYE